MKKTDCVCDTLGKLYFDSKYYSTDDVTNHGRDDVGDSRKSDTEM